MPTIDQSSMIGTSSSPMIQSAINTGKDSQKNTTDVNAALAQKYTKQTVTVPTK